MAKTVKFAVRGDIVIIGMGLSGLVAGAVLAKAGKKVILLPEEAASGGDQPNSPFVPQILCVGFERDGPVDRILNELGISLSMLRRTQEVFKKTSAYLQILFPYYRFTLYHDQKETLDDLKAGFGEKSSSVRTMLEKSNEWDSILYPFLYLQSPPVLQKGKVLRQLTAWLIYQAKVIKLKMQKASDFCKESGMDDDSIDYFNAISVYQTRQTLFQLSTLEFLQMLLFFKNEPLSAVKGLSGAREMFLKIIKENKGEIWSVTPSSLYFQKNRIAGIEFKGRDGVGCDALILNPQRGGVQGGEGKNVIQFFYFVEEEVIPPAMGDFLILKRKPELPFDETNFLYLALTEKAPSEPKDRQKSSSKRGLLVQCVVNAQNVPEDEKHLAKEIEERLIWLMPFAENRLEFSQRIVNKPEIQMGAYLSQEMNKRVAGLQKTSFPVLKLGRSLYYFPHHTTDFLITPFLIKRGYDIANIIKTGD